MPAVKGILHGASAAAVALTVAMVIKTGAEMPDGPGAGCCCSAGVFVLNGVLRWPLLGTLAIAGAAQPALGVAGEVESRRAA